MEQSGWVLGPMFFGEYEHKCDDKGRLMVPAKFRDQLSPIFYVTKGMEGCLFIYTQDDWDLIGEKIKGMSQLGRKEARAFARIFYSGASELNLDKNGRILLPANLRDYAGIDKEVFILGIADRIEIWSKDRWKAYNNEEFLNYENLSGQLMDFDI